mmetsp:Transcript_21275/g.60379  ORF Transcript_21275/g.60379 Transcript_21275/m.60379 type:complete len:654 (-) Transcript_21275:66-2027(-)
MGCNASTPVAPFEPNGQEVTEKGISRISEKTGPRCTTPVIPFGKTEGETFSHQWHCETKGLRTTAHGEDKQPSVPRAAAIEEVSDAQEKDALESRNVAEFIVQELVSYGVTHVFGGHGGAVVPLVQAICEHPQLQWICMRCEVNASLAAAAHAKLTGRLGCCVGTSGPGASHLTTGLLDAQLDGCPVICLTGMKKRLQVGLGNFQDIGQAELFHAAGIGFSATVMDPMATPALLHRAASLALEHCCCVHLALPVGVQVDPAPSHLDEAFVRLPPKLPCCYSEDIVRRCSQDLAEVQRRTSGCGVVIVVGPRAIGAAAAVEALSGAFGAHVLATVDGKGIVSERFAGYRGVADIFGHPGLESAADLLAEVEVVVAVGVQDLSSIVAGPMGIAERRVVRIDCVASRPEVGPPTHTLLGPIEEGCAALARAAPELRIVSRASGAPTPASYQVDPSELSDGFGHAGQVLHILGTKLSEGATVCVDVGDVTLNTSLCLCLDKPGQRVLASIRMGTMGYSVCGAVAACAHRQAGGKGHVVALAGDGGLQMALNEFGTLAQMGARATVIVFVNNTLGRVEHEKWPGVDKPAGCGIFAPDFRCLVEAYGGLGLRVAASYPKAVGDALDRALAHPGLSLVEVIMDPHVKPTLHKRREPIVST